MSSTFRGACQKKSLFRNINFLMLTSKCISSHNWRRETRPPGRGSSPGATPRTSRWSRRGRPSMASWPGTELLGLKLAGTASKHPGPRNLSCSGRPRHHRGGNRRTPKKSSSRHNTNRTTHLHVPSGRQVPRFLQEDGAEDGVRLLRSPAPPTIGDPLGPLSSMPSRNKD